MAGLRRKHLLSCLAWAMAAAFSLPAVVAAQSNSVQSNPVQVSVDDGCVTAGLLRLQLRRRRGWSGPVVVELVKVGRAAAAAPQRVALEHDELGANLDEDGAATLARGWPSDWPDQLGLNVRFLASSPGGLNSRVPLRARVRVGRRHRWVRTRAGACITSQGRTGDDRLRDVLSEDGVPDMDQLVQQVEGTDGDDAENDENDEPQAVRVGDERAASGTPGMRCIPRFRGTVRLSYQGPSSPTAREIQVSLRRHLLRLEQCFSHAEDGGPQRVVVRFSVETTGSAADMTFRHGDERVQRCLAAALRGIRFRPRPTENTAVQFTIRWTPRARN